MSLEEAPPDQPPDVRDYATGYAMTREEYYKQQENSPQQNPTPQINKPTDSKHKPPLSTPDFFNDGACRTSDPNLFFPDNSEGSEEAKNICRDCPVRDECLAHALIAEEKDGVWGATTAKERRGLLKAIRLGSLTLEDIREAKNKDPFAKLTETE